MTYAEQVGKAEECIEYAESEDYGTVRERYFLARAQVHATLALAAATESQSEAVREAWGSYGNSRLEDVNSIPQPR